MDQTYLVYFGDRGWWGVSGAYTTELKYAKRFGRQAAIDFCKTRYNGQMDDVVAAVPINEDDLLQVVLHK